MKVQKTYRFPKNAANTWGLMFPDPVMEHTSMIIIWYWLDINLLKE